MEMFWYNQFDMRLQPDHPGEWCHKRDSVLSSATRILCFLCMDLASGHTMLLPKLPSVDTQNGLSTITVFHAALPVTKENILHQRSEAMCSSSWIGLSNWSYHVFHYPEACWIDKWMAFSKMQLQCHLHGICLYGWGKILQRLCMLRISVHYMALFLP